MFTSSLNLSLYILNTINMDYFILLIAAFISTLICCFLWDLFIDLADYFLEPPVDISDYLKGLGRIGIAILNAFAAIDIFLQTI